MIQLLPLVLALAPTPARASGELKCELTVLPKDHDEGLTTQFLLTPGRPERGEYQGYEYYVTFQKTTRTEATYQLSKGDFFLHGSSIQPDTGAEFTGLGYDPVAKNSIYLGCKAK